MTRLRLEPAPSPNGTNREHLYLVKAPRPIANPQGALDAALRKRGHDADLGEHDAEFYRKLENLLQYHVPEEHLQAAISDLNEICGGKVYGDVREHEADDDDFDEHPDHEKLHEFAEKHHLGDDAEEELHELWSMPRNAREGGMGGRAVGDRHHADDRRRRAARDRHRRADDRRMAADDGESSFYKMFPMARRIGIA
jgi:hypothetical protein